LSLKTTPFFPLRPRPTNNIISPMPLTCWIPVPPDIYWAREWAEDAAPMLYRHEGLPYTGRIVGQRHDRTREQYWLWFIGEVAAAADAGEGFALN